MAKTAPRYRLRTGDAQRQSRGVARVRSTNNDQPTSEGSAMWERIDALAKRKGVTTQQLADAADVTWAAAKRWRQPKTKGGSEPSGENLRAIAGVLGVTTDELLRIYDGYEPQFASWQEFKGTETYKRLSVEQVKRVAATPWADDAIPTLSSWLAIAEAHLSATKKA